MAAVENDSRFCLCGGRGRLDYIVISTIRELGFAGAIKTAGGFFAFLALAYLGSRVSGIAQGMFKRCPPGAKAFLCAFGRFSSYLIFGLCCIHFYERWRENGDTSRAFIALLVVFALQLRDELEKQSSTT